MAPRSARAASGKAANRGVLGHNYAFDHGPMDRRFCRAAARTIEGRTIKIEYRWAEGHGERYAEIAAEFVRLKVDVIVSKPAKLLAVFVVDTNETGLTIPFGN